MVKISQIWQKNTEVNRIDRKNICVDRRHENGSLLSSKLKQWEKEGW